MTAPAMPGFIDPVAGTLQPAIRELEGRVVFMQPSRIDRNVPNKQDPTKPQDRAIVDLTVVDGGPLTFGALVKPRVTPPTHRIETPCTFRNAITSHTNIIRALEPALPSPAQPTGQIVLGVIEMGISTSGGNPPWNLRVLDPADPRRQQAAAVLGAILQGQFRNPEPVPISGPPVTQAQPYGAQPPPGAGQYTSSLPAPAPTPAQQAYAQPYQQQSAAPAANSYEAWLASQQPASPQLPAAPMGWPPDAWASLSDEQRTSILGAHGANTPPL